MGRARGQKGYASTGLRAQTQAEAAAAANEEAYERLCEDNADWLWGWSSTHDYDPTWDYTVDFYYRTHPLFLQAEASMQSICESAAASDLPFANGRVYPVHLNGAVAMFISGTSAEPVVLVDIDAHLAVDEDERRRAVADSVLHELRHAVQEANEWPPDEDEAEHGSERIPF
jgi:hypothetical protein